MKVEPLLSPCQMCGSYESGMTIKQIAIMSGVCVGTVFNILKKTNCKMRNVGIRKGVKLPKEWIEHSANSRRGCRRSLITRIRISESKKSHFNGMNGYGHTKIHSSGYIMAYVPDHPRATAEGYLHEHVVIMERAIGRYLEPDEVVHHINRDKTDNRLENLQLMKRSEHSRMHLIERQAKRRNDLLTELY